MPTCVNKNGLIFVWAPKNRAFLLDPICLAHLSVWSLVNLLYSCNSIATQFATKEQLKDLTHMFCFQILNYKLYKEGLFS